MRKGKILHRETVGTKLTPGLRYFHGELKSIEWGIGFEADLFGGSIARMQSHKKVHRKGNACVFRV